MSTAREKVVVAMSGGVDSSVAAALLLREGYDAIGVFMRLGSPDGVEAADPASGRQGRGCCSVLDAGDARTVANRLGIPFYVLNFQQDFGRVIDYFISEYNLGRTPNPCVRCNEWLKFGRLAAYAEAVGARYIATGHYARIQTIAGETALLRGLDPRKDQSYVLFGIQRQAFERMLLPIGGLHKPQVRAIAQELDLPVFNKPDSQEICFVPDDNYAGLIGRRSPGALRPGSFVDASGKSLGQHGGHQHFTIGQRKGLGIAAPHPLYVIDIDARSNQVTLGPKDQLLRGGLTAARINWLASPPSVEGAWLPCQAKIRYNHPPQGAQYRFTGPDAVEVRFEQPQSAITPGQAVVIYDGERVLGGGWIERSLQ